MLSAKFKLFSIRIAVVGSGPAAFFTSAQLLKYSTEVQIDMFEKNILPFGLVRNGIAPDHQPAKNVQNKFCDLLDNDRLRYYGNVEVGHNISVKKLSEQYSAVLLTYGAQTDNRLNIEGEDKRGVYTSRQIVEWYNSQPDYFDISPCLNGETAVVVGNGNVSIDIARVLLKEEGDLRIECDLTERIHSKLRNSKVRQVHLLGRRGVVEAAFTMIEAKQLNKLKDVTVAAYREEVEAAVVENDITEYDDENPGIAKMKQKKHDFVRKLRLLENGEKLEGKAVYFRFLQSPKKIIGDGKVEAIEIEERKREKKNGLVSYIETGEKSIIEAGLVVTSLGYKVQDLSDGLLLYDEQHSCLASKFGQAFLKDGVLSENIFVSGWAKRGPRGIIDMTLRDSYETADCILKLIAENKLEAKKEENKKWLPRMAVSNVEAKKIMMEEESRGRALGKPREKFETNYDMLKFLGKL